MQIELFVDIGSGQLSSMVNGRSASTLPISLTGIPETFRLIYDGGGAGNTNVMLIDEISVHSLPQNASRTWMLY
jgi:hypothetical protein